MGTLTIATFMTLDGIMQAPGGPDEDRDDGFEHGGWSFPYASEDKRDVLGGAFARADGFLLGRRTYEIFAASWPNFPDPSDPVASRLNTLPKYVVSTTLATAEWARPRSSATTSSPRWRSSRLATQARSRSTAALPSPRRCTPTA
jgi:dihydrofolate reductase